MTITYPLPTLAAVVSPTGISAPTYAEILQSLQTSFGLIYGSDVYLDPSSQDGQLLAIFAQAIYDANSCAIAVWNQFSPSTAQGTGLSSLVKINGLSRLVASNSNAAVNIGGTPGTTIVNGIVADSSGNQWALPASVVIPGTGTITVEAVAVNQGAITAAANTITTIATPVFGWSTVANPAAANPGNPVETDAQLRLRQAASVSLQAVTPLAATVAAVEALPGVTAVAAFENATSAVDANGAPAHSIYLTVSGGNPISIAQAIANKKTPGCATYGSTSETIVDSVGVSHSINFNVTALVRVQLQITINPLSGYTSSVGTALVAALSAYVSGLSINQNVQWGRLWGIAYSVAGAGTFEVTALTINIYGNSPGTADLTIPYTSQASLAIADVALTT